MDNTFVLDSFTWSFSRINAYVVCPQSFYLQYIKCVDTENGFFGEWGSFGHLVLEKYFNKELEFFDLSKEYEKEYYNNVKHKAPPNAFVDLNQKYYNAGKEYFDNFWNPFEYCKILGVEQEIHIKIGKYNFVGYIDLILEDNNGNIIIVDHKSKKMFTTKKEKQEYLRQLYLYSIYIYEKYNRHPSKLIFNMFRENEIIEEIFDIKAFEEAKKWALDTIQNIYDDVEFKVNKKEFFCNYICSVNSQCPCSSRYLNF